MPDAIGEMHHKKQKYVQKSPTNRHHHQQQKHHTTIIIAQHICLVAQYNDADSVLFEIRDYSITEMLTIAGKHMSLVHIAHRTLEQVFLDTVKFIQYCSVMLMVWSDAVTLPFRGCVMLPANSFVTHRNPHLSAKMFASERFV